MKTILIPLFLISILIAPVLVCAQEMRPLEYTCTPTHPDDELARYINCGANPSTCCLIDRILTVGDYIFIGVLVAGIIVIVLAAWTFLTSSGEPDKIKRARNMLIYGVIGIGVAFLTKVIIRVVVEAMT